MQTTFTEMSAARMRSQETAFQYERVKTAAETLRARVQQLEKISTDGSVEALNSIITLTEDVDPDLLTKSTELVAGGFIVRELLRRAAEQALVTLADAAAKNASALAKARADLEPVEAELAKFS